MNSAHPTPPIPQCFTVKDVAKRLGVSVWTIRRYLLDEPGIVRVGGELRKMSLIPEPVLERFLTRHTKAQYNLPHADNLSPAQRQVPSQTQRPRLAPLPLPNLGGRYLPGRRTAPKPQNPELGKGPQNRRLLGTGRS